MNMICVSFSAPHVHVVCQNERDTCIESEKLIRNAVARGVAITINSVMCADRQAAERVAAYLRDLRLELIADQVLDRAQVSLP